MPSGKIFIQKQKMEPALIYQDRLHGYHAIAQTPLRRLHGQG